VAAVAALVAAVALAAATAAAVIALAAEATAAVAVPVAAVVVVTAVAVAATKQILSIGATSLASISKKGPLGPFCFGQRLRWCVQASPLRCLRGRPANILSNMALGKLRSALATQPICHGITRYDTPATMVAYARAAKSSGCIRNGMA
jgi:hypothetical protein